MNRLGVIYEIKGKKAVILTNESEFVIINRRRDMSTGQQVSFENEDIYNPKRRTILYTAAAVSSVAAVLAVMFLYFQAAFLRNTTNIYGYIDIDINPSIELVIDESHQVLEVKLLNEDSKQLVEGLDLTDKNVESVIPQMVRRSIDIGFISAGDDRKVVLVSGALNDKRSEYKLSREDEESKLSRLLYNIKTEIDGMGDITGHTVLTTPEERKDALENKLSMGKYSLYLEAEELDSGITVEEVYDMSVTEIISKLEEMKLASGEGSNPEPGDVATHAVGETPERTLAPIHQPTLPKVPEISVSPIKTNTPRPSEGTSGDETPRPSILPEKSKNVGAGTKAVRIQYFSKDAIPDTQGIDFSFRMYNTGNEIIDMRDLKVRYYFEEDLSIDEMNWAVYFYSLGVEKDVRCNFYDLPGKVEANKYLEITFEAGTFSPNDIMYITGAFYQNNWGEFDQQDDYSYNPSDSYVDWERMTAYISDKLVWGIEPN